MSGNDAAYTFCIKEQIHNKITKWTILSKNKCTIMAHVYIKENQVQC